MPSIEEGGLKILHIEDDQSMMTALQLILRGDASIDDKSSKGINRIDNTDIVEDLADDDLGGVTMAIKADPPYDLIVTDGDLIGTKNGHDAIREIRAAGITTPIIMASANLDLVRMVQDDDSIPNKEPLRFVTKPLRSKDLLATANALLAGGDDPAPSGSTPTTKPDTPKR